jgi:tetratricopeptide (TPR) repeat protein
LAELLKKPDQAKKWYQGIESGEQLHPARLRLAVLAEQAGDLAEAQGILRGLQESDSDDGRALIDAFLLEAELLIKHADLAAALAVYERGLQRFEDDSGLLYARALLHERMDRIDLAEDDFRRMLMADPENADVLNALGYTLADRTERLDEAFEFIRRALDAQPDNPAILDSMGWVLFRQGKLDEALPFLQRAFELQRDAEVAAHLGEALWALGREDEARSIWRLGREIDAENRALKRVLLRLAPEL